jgi:anaerobic dimethyl sulfoxide reductase subunit B
MVQWAFYFDQTRCINCKTCVLACKAWNEDKRGDAAEHPLFDWGRDERVPALSDEGPESPILPGSENARSGGYMHENWRRVTVTEYGDIPPRVDVLNLSLACQHCSNPACLQVCPVQRLIKEPEFGIVAIDPTRKCLACGLCREACPWHCPQFSAGGPIIAGSNTAMTKCDLCIDRLRDGLKPACVAACLMRALDAGPRIEIELKYPGWSSTTSDFASDQAARLNIHTRPNIIFKKKIIKIEVESVQEKEQ